MNRQLLERLVAIVLTAVLASLGVGQNMRANDSEALVNAMVSHYAQVKCEKY